MDETIPSWLEPIRGPFSSFDEASRMWLRLKNGDEADRVAIAQYTRVGQRGFRIPFGVVSVVQIMEGGSADAKFRPGSVDAMEALIAYPNRSDFLTREEFLAYRPAAGRPSAVAYFAH